MDDPVSQLREKYVKEKGLFITSPRLGKGMDSLIVSKALQNYFGKGIPIEDTIKSSPFIWDFIKFERVGKQFEVLWNKIPQQRTNRFYVKRNGPYLYKVKEDLKFDSKSGKQYTSKTYQHLLKGFGVQIMNEYKAEAIKDYNINYQYYISGANSLLNELEPKQKLLF